MKRDGVPVPKGHRTESGGAPPRPRTPLARIGATGRRRRDEERNRAVFARAFKLAVCGSLDSRLHAHHVLLAQWIEREGRTRGLVGDDLLGAIYDPDVAIAITGDLHMRLHARQITIHLEDLPGRVVDRVQEVWGEPGMVELERLHPRKAVA